MSTQKIKEPLCCTAAEAKQDLIKTASKQRIILILEVGEEKSHIP